MAGPLSRRLAPAASLFQSVAASLLFTIRLRIPIPLHRCASLSILHRFSRDLVENSVRYGAFNEFIVIFREVLRVSLVCVCRIRCCRIEIRGLHFFL